MQASMSPFAEGLLPSCPCRLRVHTSRRAAAEERVACTGAAATGPGGAATSSTAGGPPPPAAPPVPRLDLSRLQDEATEASRSRHRRCGRAVYR